MPPKPDRTPCVVPFCRRTTKPPVVFEGATVPEWICGDHWKLIPKKYRRAYGRHVRRWRRYSPATPWPLTAARLWRRLRTIAIERGAGI